MGTQILENYLVGLLKVGKSKIRKSQSYRLVFVTYSERERIRAPAAKSLAFVFSETILFIKVFWSCVSPTKKQHHSLIFF
ncbi:hypothetical protein N9E56_02410 [Flavobacteriaceae bacterium]|nr:hypothetical protein [Flavobacteriaceae bacterium]